MLAVQDANANAAPPADIAVWRPSNGTWYVMGGQGSNPTNVPWGMSGDQPVPGDFDGDGKTDFSVFRPSQPNDSGTWYISNSGNGYTIEVPFGVDDDTVAPADYDGDGRTDMAVFRPSNGTWYIQKSSLGFTSQAFGVLTDIVAPADYDGDGKADIGVWRNSASTFYVMRSSDGLVQYQTISGASSTEVVSADYDGDGKADFALRNGVSWIIAYSAGNYVPQTVTWHAGDVAVHNDYDGDGKVDVAVWQASIGWWFIRQSSKEGQPPSVQLRQEQWGAPTDKPVPAFFRR